MEEYIKIEKLAFEQSLNSNDKWIIRKLLAKEKGVIKAGINESNLRVEYNSYLTNITELQTLLSDAGYNSNPPIKAKRFSRFIQNLAKSNQNSFGKGKLDCCKFNG